MFDTLPPAHDFHILLQEYMKVTRGGGGGGGGEESIEHGISTVLTVGKVT